MRLVVALALVAEVLAAQPLITGNPFPLTNTRYRAATGRSPLLLSNGAEPILFWNDGSRVRTTRIGAAAGRVVLLLGNIVDAEYDAVWTGRQFLVVAQTANNGLATAGVGAGGEPLSPFPAALGVPYGSRPRVAWNGRNALLLYVESGTVHTLLLTADGKRAESSPHDTGVIAEGRLALTSNGSTFAAVVPRSLEPRLLVFDGGGNLASNTVLGSLGSAAAIASDGRRYLILLACTTEGGTCGTAYARLVDADGSIGRVLALDPPHAWQPSAFWSGSEWIAAYTVGSVRPTTLNVLHLGADARAVDAREQRPGGESSFAVAGGRVVAAWSGPHFNDTISVAPLPFAGESARPASIAATMQFRPAAATSADALLVVWQEHADGVTTLHSGVRRTNGQWSEQPIVSFPPPADCYVCFEDPRGAIAASDGREFIVSVGQEPFLRWLDANGVPLGEPIPLPDRFFVGQILWSGSDYLLYNGLITHLSTAGALSAPLPLPRLIGGPPTLATDGKGGLLAVWIDATATATTSVSALRLDRELQPIDATPIVLAANDAQLRALSAAWDGEAYVVAWSGTDGVKAARIAATPKVTSLSGDAAQDTSVVPMRGGALIRWLGTDTSQFAALLRRDGTATAPSWLSYDDAEQGIVAALPDGDAAYLEPDRLFEPPFDQTFRIVMQTLSTAALPPAPSAPVLIVHAQTPQQFVLVWGPVREPVSGWRVEVRHGDDPWIELDPALGPDAHSLLVPDDGTLTAVRIRAWNGAGLGSYSNFVVLNPVRRHAVR